jgi:Holliday junction resolvase
MESKIQAKIKKYMTEKGYKVLKIIQLSENGFPDLMCLKDGEVVWIEVKSLNGIQSELQKYRQKELQKLGFKSFCVNSLEQLKEIL